MLLDQAGVAAEVKVRDLTEDETGVFAGSFRRRGRVEGDLRKEVTQSIKRLMEIGSYRGCQAPQGSAGSWQRTHTNARTRKGPRRATVAGRKKVGK